MTRQKIKAPNTREEEIAARKQVAPSMFDEATPDFSKVSAEQAKRWFDHYARHIGGFRDIVSLLRHHPELFDEVAS